MRKPEPKPKIGTKIVALRARMGSTQVQLVERADISVAYMGENRTKQYESKY